jgi:hypothetical protein
MGIDAAGRVKADHLRKEGIIVPDQVFRKAAGPYDLLTVIDVIQEGIDRADPLLDPPHQQRPFTGADDPWHQVERDQPLIRFGFAIDIECDARAPEHGLRIA